MEIVTHICWYFDLGSAPFTLLESRWSPSTFFIQRAKGDINIQKDK